MSGVLGRDGVDGLAPARSEPMAAAGVTGYDSAYAGESAFVFISPGQTQNFQVFFVNTGTTTWVRGTGTQVDLAACLADKVTCNAQDATEAGWNTNWLSPVRDTTHIYDRTGEHHLYTSDGRAIFVDARQAPVPISGNASEGRGR